MKRAAPIMRIFSSLLRAVGCKLVEDVLQFSVTKTGERIIQVIGAGASTQTAGDAQPA